MATPTGARPRGARARRARGGRHGRRRRAAGSGRSRGGRRRHGRVHGHGRRHGCGPRGRGGVDRASARGRLGDRGDDGERPPRAAARAAEARRNIRGEAPDGVTAPASRTAATTADTPTATPRPRRRTPAASASTRRPPPRRRTPTPARNPTPAVTAGQGHGRSTAATDAPAPSGPPPTDRERFERLADGLAARLRVSQAAEGARMRMQLEPRELGEVVVRLEVHDGVAHASPDRGAGRDAGRAPQRLRPTCDRARRPRRCSSISVSVRVAGEGASNTASGQTRARHRPSGGVRGSSRLGRVDPARRHGGHRYGDRGPRPRAGRLGARLASAVNQRTTERTEGGDSRQHHDTRSPARRQRRHRHERRRRADRRRRLDGRGHVPEAPDGRR